jgi:hypothetical protein
MKPLRRVSRAPNGVGTHEASDPPQADPRSKTTVKRLLRRAKLGTECTTWLGSLSTRGGGIPCGLS